MAIRQLNPYLNFNGTAEKAIKLYETALGAKTENIQRFGDIPGSDAPPETRNRVIHAKLNIGNGGVIMISDNRPGDALIVGNNNYVCLDFEDAADMTKKFDALAAGGKVEMPIQDTFWGAKFGICQDPYGINWMFNCETKKG